MGLPVLAIIITATVALSSMLLQIRGGLDVFNLTNQGLTNIGVSALSSATFTAKKSNQFLSSLSRSLNASAQLFLIHCVNDEGEVEFSQDCADYIYGQEAELKHDRENLVLNYAQDLQDTANNGINDNLLYGFQGGKLEVKEENKLYKDFKYTLLNSSHPSPRTKNDKTKRASTILSHDKAQALSTEIDPYSLTSEFLGDQGDYYIHNLRIDSELLESMIEDEDLKEILQDFSHLFGLEIDNPNHLNTDIGFNTLANGLKLDITLNDLAKKRNLQTNTKEGEEDKSIENEILTRYSVAQLRAEIISDEISAPAETDSPVCPTGAFKDDLGRCPCPNTPSKYVFDESECPTVVPPNDPPTSNPSNPTGNPPVIGDPDIEDPEVEDFFTIDIQSVPSGRHGIIVDPDDPNNVTVINTKSGNFTNIDQNEEGDLEINLGSLPKGTAKDTEFETEDRGTAGSFGDPEGNDQGTILIDSLPRSRKRFGSVDTAMNLNGLDIPPGAVVVAQKKKGVKSNRPGKNQMASFKIYDPETGALITQVKGSKLKKKDKKNLSFDYTEKGTVDENGNRVFQSLNTKDMFTGEDAGDRALAFTNVLAEQAASDQMNINLKKKNWQKKVFNQMKKEDVSYIRDVMQREGVDAASALTFGQREFIDDTAREYHNRAFENMLELDAKRQEVTDLEERLLQQQKGSRAYKDLKAEIERAKDDRRDAKKATKQSVKASKKYNKKRIETPELKIDSKSPVISDNVKFTKLGTDVKFNKSVLSSNIKAPVLKTSNNKVKKGTSVSVKPSQIVSKPSAPVKKITTTIAAKPVIKAAPKPAPKKAAPKKSGKKQGKKR